MKVASEEQVARVTVSADAALLQPVIEFVGRMTHQLGLIDDEHIEGAVELVCLNVIEHAFGPEEEGSLDVYVLRGAGGRGGRGQGAALRLQPPAKRRGRNGAGGVAPGLRRGALRKPRTTWKQGRATKASPPRRRQGASARRRTPQYRGGTRRIRGCSAGDQDDASGGILRALALCLPVVRLQLRLGLYLLSGQDQGAAGEGPDALLRRRDAGGRVRGPPGRQPGTLRFARRGGRAGGGRPALSGAPSLPQDEDLHGGAVGETRHVRAIQRGHRRTSVQPAGEPTIGSEGDRVPAWLYTCLRLVQADRGGEGGKARVSGAVLHARAG